MRKLLLIFLLAMGQCLAAAGATRIVSIADPRGSSPSAYVNTGVLNNVISSIIALDPQPDAVVVGGDMIYSPSNVDNGYDQFTNCMNRLVDTGIPYYCALGNHELGADWYPKWQAAFDVPQNGPAQWLELAYYVDVGDARLIFLDSVSDGTNWLGAAVYRISPVQRNWLESVSGTNSPLPFDVLVSHIPAYPATVTHENSCLNVNPVDRDEFLQILVDNKATAYLSGHEHLFYRRTVDTRYNAAWTRAIPHIVNCSGAPLYYAISTNTPQPEALSVEYNFTVLDLDPETGAGTATTYSEDGLTILDQVPLQGKYLQLRLAFTNTHVSESQAILSDWGLVSIPDSLSSDLTVFLSSSDLSEIVVTDSVVIAAGTTSTVFNVSVVNDSQYDGRTTAMITAQAQGYLTCSGILEVADSGGGVIDLVGTGSVWKYLDDGSDRGTAWREPGYDDGFWGEGFAQLGYGDGDEATVLNFGGDPSNKFVTTYFRHYFELAAPAGLDALKLSLLHDDGAVLYLNGVEVFRTNMPAGTIDYMALAQVLVSEPEEDLFFDVQIDSTPLVAGTNVLAVEIHQASPESSDVSLDLSLAGVRFPRASFAQTSVIDKAVSVAQVALDGFRTNNFSGCCIMPSTSELLVVLNGPPMIQVYDQDGTYDRRITLTGFMDTESICQYDTDNDKYAICEEGVNTFVIVTITSNTATIARSSGEIIDTGLLSDDVNKALEGVTYDPVNHCFYTIQEKLPMAVYRVTPSGTGFVTEELFDAEQVFAGKCTDLSDLFYDPNWGRLFILSDESRLVFECDLSGNIISALPVPFFQPEGMTFSCDGKDLFIVGEPNEYARFILSPVIDSGSEGTTARFRVDLSSPSTDPVSVDFSISSATALPGQDFTPSAGTLVFAPGSTAEMLSFDILADSEPEGDEILRIALTNSSGVTLGPSDLCDFTINGNKVLLEVFSSHGNALPPVGTNLMTYGTNMTCSMASAEVINGTTQYVCVGWAGSGCVPFSGSGTVTPSFVLTNNSSIAWNWRTNYWLDSGASTGGTVDVPDDWYRSGTSVTIVATNDDHYHFAGWSGNTAGCSIAGRQIDVPMTMPRAVTANFEIDVHTLQVTSAGGGAVPDVGVNSYPYNTLLACSITNSPTGDASTQYVCTGWIGTGSVPSPGVGTVTPQFALTENSTIVWNWEGRPPSLQVTFAAATVDESDGLLSSFGQVRTQGPVGSDLPIVLVSDDPTELVVTNALILPGGASEVSFDVTIIDDSDLDGAQLVRVTATAAGFQDGTNTVGVLDDDVDHFTFSSISSPQTPGLPFRVTVDAWDIDNVRIASYGDSADLAGSGDGGSVSVLPSSAGPFAGGQWTGDVTVQSADTNVQLTVNDGLGHIGTSNPFDVLVEPVDHFEWSVIPSPQYLGVAIPVTLTAKAASGNRVVGFSGSVLLSGLAGAETGPAIVISEVKTGTPDAMEFVNVSRDQVDISGWQVHVYDDASGRWPDPLAAFVIPAGTVCGPGEVFQVEERNTAPGTYPHFYTGINIWWTDAVRAGVLLRDETGNIVDFMCAAGADPADISDPLAIPTNEWYDAAVPAQTNTLDTYQRIGDGDSNGSLDWTTGDDSVGAVNDGLAVPFVSTIVSVSISPTVTTSFVEGVWTGTVTVMEGSTDMYLTADDGNGNEGTSGTFDVESLLYLAVSSAHGGGDPPAGTNYYDFNSALICSITNSPVDNGFTRHECVGWTGSGSVPLQGAGSTTPSFMLVNNSGISWIWQTDYWLGADIYGSGVIVGGNDWMPAGSNVTVEAFPSEYFHFAGWSGDVGAADTNNTSISVVMDSPRFISAAFVPDLTTNSTPKWWLVRYYPDSTNDFVGAALSDTDNDSSLAWEEYAAGTDPTNRYSVLRIVDIQRSNEGYVVVLWSSVSNRLYNVRRSRTLLPAWQFEPFVNDIQGDSSGTNIFVHTNSVRGELFRIEVQ